LKRKFPFRRTPQRCRYGCRIFCFDPPKLHRFDPDFEWRGTLISALAHLLAGGMQSLSMNGIELSRGRGSHRGLFAWGEIGMLNYLVHAMVQRKKLMLAMSDL